MEEMISSLKVKPLAPIKHPGGLTEEVPYMFDHIRAVTSFKPILTAAASQADTVFITPLPTTSTQLPKAGRG